MRQSSCWWCYTGRGVADEALLQAAAEIGYQAYICTSFPTTRLAERPSAGVRDCE